MDKILFLTMLYDFYGELLTDKQKETFELYYLDDLSLSEITSRYDNKISRQSVLDNIKRTEKKLLHYEEKLSLVEKYLNQRKIIDNIIDNIKNIISNNNLSNNDIFFLKNICKDLDSLLD